MNQQRIAIIGAGISGLACATELVKCGFEVSIFDKSRGVGGRMSHRYFQEWGADHGAQYFTVKDERFAEEVKKWEASGTVKAWGGKIVSLDNGNITDLKSERNRYVGMPTMSAPAKYLASTLNISLLHTIAELKWNKPLRGSKNKNGTWQLVSKEQGLLPQEFDHVVLAIPSPQAKVLIGEYSDQLTETCDQVVMLPCWTLMAYLKNPLKLDFDGAFVQNHLFSWIARDSNKPGRSPYESWVAQASSDWSLENIDLSQPEAEALLLKGFKELTGAVCDLYQTHLWRYSKLETPSDTNFVIDTHLNMSLCGDWLRNSTVEGAWMSGYTLAQRLSLMDSIDTL
jgi:predicted NAD/FAD-dependent oxidoreductase